MAPIEQTLADLTERTGYRWPVHLNLLRNTLAVLGVVFILASGSYLLAGLHLELGPKVIASASALLLVIFTLVLAALPSHGHLRFGYANLVTAIRAAMVSIVGATFLFAKLDTSTTVILWTMVGLVIGALSLDGIDGYLARRFRQESKLGARFDMEVDALLVLILSTAGLILDKAGIWILLIGSMRYLFIAAQQLLPKLQADLPPSFRRKAVCVIQVGALCLLIVPAIAPPVSTGIAALALVLLIYSFAVDTIYLLTRPVMR